MLAGHVGGPRRGAALSSTAQAPAAQDADGRVVPVTWKLQGVTMVMHVEHPAGRFAMPILVDPYVADDQRYR